MCLHLSLPLRLSPLLLLGALLPQLVFAQTVQTNEYIYIGIEAEDHLAKHERWVTTTPSTPMTENDPDGNHSDQASGSTYLELLPDMRVTHEDTFGPPTAYWGRGGQGPDADYQVNFPEPGRYYVHVRAYSTGTEDNGMHVGIDGTWPESGQKMQFCSASRRAWWWGSAQRDAGGNGSCGVEKTIWLDVDTAGTHTVSISAREDGFEIDRLAFIKDLSNNTRICSPRNISDVNCRNGSIDSADGFVDLRVRLSADAVGADPEADQPNPLEIEAGGEITLTARIENLDAFDTANDIVLTLSPVAGDWEMIDMDSRCSEADSEFTCTLDKLKPTAPDENEAFVFTMKAADDGNSRIDAAVMSAEIDDTPANDVAATVVTVSSAESSDLQLAMTADNASYEIGDSINLEIVISNVGSFVADDVSFAMSVPPGLAVKSAMPPARCSTGSEIACSFTSINAAGNEVIQVELLVLAAGLNTLAGNVDASSDENTANNIDSISVQTVVPMVETTTDGSVDSGGSAGETAGETAGDTAGKTAGETTGDNSGTGSTTNSDTATMGSGSSDGAIAGVTAGTTAGAMDATAGQGTSATDAQPVNGDAGATTHWFLLLLAILCSARLYGWHQRQRITVR